MNRVYHPCHKIKTNLMSSNKWSIGSLLWAIDPVCEWAGCCFFFFLFSPSSSAEKILPGQQYPGNHQPSSALGTDHMLLQTQCVLMCACVAVVRLTRTNTSEKSFYARLWRGSQLDFAFVVTLSGWRWGSVIHIFTVSARFASLGAGGGKVRSETRCVLGQRSQVTAVTQHTAAFKRFTCRWSRHRVRQVAAVLVWNCLSDRTV